MTLLPAVVDRRAVARTAPLRPGGRPPTRPAPPSSTTPELWGAVVAIWVAVVLVVIAPTIVILASPDPDHGPWYLPLIITTIAGARYAWIIGEGYRRLVEMSFWVFTYVFMGLAPIAQLRMQADTPTTPRIDHSLDGRTVLLITVGLLAFLVGLQIARLVWSRLPQALVDVDQREQAINLPRAVFLSLFALAVNAYWVSSVGVGSLFASRFEATEQAQSALGEGFVTAIISATAMMSLLVSFIATVKYYVAAERKDRLLLALIVVLGLTLLVTVNPISSARYLFGTAALAVTALFGLYATKGRFRTVAILAVVGLALIFPFADAFRYSSSGQFKSTDPLQSLTSPDYDAFQQVNNTIHYVDSHGTTSGNQALGVILFWVPRKYWENKATDTGVLLAKDRQYQMENLSAPLWSELYINGGWPILILGMMVVGLIAGVQDRRIERSLLHARAPTILACILPFYLIILLRGSLLQAMSFLVIIVGSAIFVSQWRWLRIPAARRATPVRARRTLTAAPRDATPGVSR